jgi:hypothetical protein
MTRTEISQLANHIVDRLHELAEAIEPEYYEECAGSSCTNREGVNDTERVIRHLVATAALVNASGLCDLPTEGREILLAICGLNVGPLTYQWYI